jgi:serine/threonine protein phosphatase PrpC
MILDKQLVFVNVGDSRGIISQKNGQIVKSGTFDHKPQFFSEMQRIFKNNGQLYRVCSNSEIEQTEIFYASSHQEFLDIDRLSENSNKIRVFGPWRVKPGGLSVIFIVNEKVSRTFGDIEGKIEELGGIRGVISPEPEVTVFEYSEDIDYILLGCDGIFDELSNDEVNRVIWETVDFYKEKALDTLERTGEEFDYLGICLNDCVNNVLKKSMIENSEDNVTAILVAFKNLLKS